MGEFSSLTSAILSPDAKSCWQTRENSKVMMRSVKPWKKFYEELEGSMPEEIYWGKKNF